MTGRNRLQEPHLFQKNLLLFSKKSLNRLAGTAKFVLLSPETSTTLTFFYKNPTIVLQNAIHNVILLLRFLLLC